MVFPGTMRNVSYIEGRVSSQHKAEINEEIVYECLSFGNGFIHIMDAACYRRIFSLEAEG